jgi:hypothetical protein
MPIDNRTETIAFRVTKSEREEIERIAKLNRLKLSEYVRLIALNLLRREHGTSSGRG